MDWFKRYKVPDGKPENQFAFNAEFKDRVIYSSSKLKFNIIIIKVINLICTYLWYILLSRTLPLQQ